MKHARIVIALSLGLVIGYGGSTSFAQDGGYAVNIVDHSPQGPDFHPATNVLGLPDAERIGGLDTGATDFARVDALTPGYVIVEFSPPIIQDVAGEDIVVHLYDWHAAEQEIFHVDVSMNGIDFYRIATLDPNDYTGQIFERFALGFDFGGAGLDDIRYVAIVNGRIHVAPFGHEGPDIDAVEAISLVPEPAVVSVDIKPGSCPNPLNRSSHGVVPVALVGLQDFDVMDIEVSTVRLSRADGSGAEVAPHEGPPGPHSVFEDVATPFEGEACDCHELEGDGIVDLSMKFRADDVVEALELDDLNNGDEVELVITGTLLDGTGFASAGDCILIVPPGNSNLSVEANVGDVFVDLTPMGLKVDGGGFPAFDRSYDPGTVITLTAPASADGRSFRAWKIDGVLQPAGQTVVEVTIVGDATARALYHSQTIKQPGLGDHGGWPVPVER